MADEPYNLEMQPLEHPHAADCQVFLTADPNTVAEGCNVRPANPLSIANNADALRTRSQTLGYTRDWGELGGGVTYIALGHCHSAGTNNQTAQSILKSDWNEDLTLEEGTVIQVISVISKLH